MTKSMIIELLPPGRMLSLLFFWTLMGILNASTLLPSKLTIANLFFTSHPVLADHMLS